MYPVRLGKRERFFGKGLDVMRKTKGAYIIFGLALLASAYFIWGAMSKSELLLDGVVSHSVMTVFKESTYPFFCVVSELGDTMGVGIVALLVLVWLWMKRRDYFGIAIFVIAVALGNEVSKLIKELVGRERPAVSSLTEETLSFPSGHAMVGLTLYMLIAYFIIMTIKSMRIKWGVALVAFLIILFIGLSRIVLEAHFPTDVFGGYSLGLIWTILGSLYMNGFMLDFLKNRIYSRVDSIFMCARHGL